MVRSKADRIAKRISCDCGLGLYVYSQFHAAKGELGQGRYRPPIERALEDCIQGQVERTIEGRRCLLGTCDPQWPVKQGRFMHVEPCAMSIGERLLRERIEPRLDYSITEEEERAQRPRWVS